jgi:hypothetical protein
LKTAYFSLPSRGLAETGTGLARRKSGSVGRGGTGLAVNGRRACPLQTRRAVAAARSVFTVSRGRRAPDEADVAPHVSGHLAILRVGGWRRPAETRSGERGVRDHSITGREGRP